MNKKKIKLELLEQTESMVISSGAKLYECHYCKIHYENAHLNLDHKIPKNKGGSNEITNLTLSCKKCNTVKDSYDYEEFKYFINYIGQEEYNNHIKTLRRFRGDKNKKRAFRDKMMYVINKFRNS